ncbi:MAG: hypothetical protein ACRDL7_02320, partial [Gaiellaceae bacterium]
MRLASRYFSILVLTIAPWLAGAAFADGVHVGLGPAVQSVPAGADFVIEVRVTEAGSAFNAFDLVVGFDPSALTFMPASP